MAPYNPPNTHYSQLSLNDYNIDMILSFMGKGGKRFYNLTTLLKVRYIWFNSEKNIIEIWGPYESFRDYDPVNVIRNEINMYKNVYKNNISNIV